VFTKWNKVGEDGKTVFPGNDVIRWLAVERHDHSLQVIMSRRSADGKWLRVYGADSSEVTAKVVAWAEIDEPKPPVKVPSKLVDPNQLEAEQREAEMRAR
jgi:hypothetical protein